MPTTNPTQQAEFTAICLTQVALDDVAMAGMNYPSSRLYYQRLSALCALKGCDLADLTLREILSCRAAADLEYSDQFPVLFPGHQSRPTADVLANYPQGALA